MKITELKKAIVLFSWLFTEEKAVLVPRTSKWKRLVPDNKHTTLPWRETYRNPSVDVRKTLALRSVQGGRVSKRITSSETTTHGRIF